MIQHYIKDKIQNIEITDEYFEKLENIYKHFFYSKAYLLSILEDEKTLKTLLKDNELFYYHYFDFLPDINNSYYKQLSEHTKTHEKFNCLIFEILIRDKNELKLIGMTPKK